MGVPPAIIHFRINHPAIKGYPHGWKTPYIDVLFHLRHRSCTWLTHKYLWTSYVQLTDHRSLVVFSSGCTSESSTQRDRRDPLIQDVPGKCVTVSFDLWTYPLVNKQNHGTSPCLMGKSINSNFP